MEIHRKDLIDQHPVVLRLTLKEAEEFEEFLHARVEFVTPGRGIPIQNKACTLLAFALEEERERERDET